MIIVGNEMWMDKKKRAVLETVKVKRSSSPHPISESQRVLTSKKGPLSVRKMWAIDLSKVVGS